MFKRRVAFVLAVVSSLYAQAPLENDGKPMRVPYQCASAETQGAGLGCAEDEPCPVYIELANVAAVGGELFVTGNIHTPMVTLSSILLASQDDGKSWSEPYPRQPSSGLDQIQFLDFQYGWISGANLQTAPRDPFLLLTTDGGKTWRQQRLFDETRVAAIERFSFDSPKHGLLSVDASLDNGKHEVYETHDGGASWIIQQTSDAPISFPAEKPQSPGWRVRTDAATHSYVIEKSQNNRWQKMASFLVQIATCQE
ncbi:MAG TPA: hypothetical protein VME17_23935 [Bryobacteraceae bacterium]|nr:hypothetical protein [Bryobacteraceae bacterium]